MEDSRKGKRDDEKGLSTPSPHVDEKKGKKAIVYKTKKEKRKGDGKLFENHSTGTCLRRLFA